MSQNDDREQTVKVTVVEGAEPAESETTEMEMDAEVTGTPESPEDEPAPEETLEEKLAGAENALKEEKDRLLRHYAEFENFRKRSAREMQDFRRFANENLIRDLLPIVDNLERAIASSSRDTDDQRCILEGVEITLKEILKVLERHNVTPVESLGQPFDPRFHEAVGAEESAAHPDNSVLREFQKGYLLHDRLIRPAMVIVSKGAPKAAEQDPEDPPSREENDDEKNDTDTDELTA